MRCIIMTFKFEFLSWPDPQLKAQRPQAQALAFKPAAEPELIKLPIPRLGSQQFLMGAGAASRPFFQQQNLSAWAIVENLCAMMKVAFPCPRYSPSSHEPPSFAQ